MGVVYRRPRFATSNIQYLSSLSQVPRLPQEVRASQRSSSKLQGVCYSHDGHGRRFSSCLVPGDVIKQETEVWTVIFVRNILSQTSMKDFCLPRLKQSELKKIENSLAMHFYITGTSFQRVEEKYLIDAFKVARPDVVLPNRKILAGRALERTYEKVRIASEKALKLSNRLGCVITDASSNTNNESIVNYMIVSDRLSQFLESIATEEQSHTAEFIADDLDRVIQSLTARKLKLLVQLPIILQRTGKPGLSFSGDIQRCIFMVVHPMDYICWSRTYSLRRKPKKVDLLQTIQKVTRLSIY
ncbi:hypothetical protein BASA61_005322 [Batrachochytrium salamandrivorans]|nr:hypothetical protein BASA61_005322 [Batrachochytrium salamandrivorans]